MSHGLRRSSAALAMLGGLLGLLLAPILVVIKYMTGWSIVPQPFWVASAQSSLGDLLRFASPQELWTFYGSLYTLALCCMLLGLCALAPILWRGGFAQKLGYGLLVAGLVLVIPGDAIHSWTWYRSGISVPTPGSDPLPNTAYAVHMMGMNFVMAGSMLLGLAALRARRVARWLAWSFVAVFPAAVLASMSMLPTTPSGALWLFSALMLASGWQLARGGVDRLRMA
jgi:hypothetical protein